MTEDVKIGCPEAVATGGGNFSDRLQKRHIRFLLLAFAGLLTGIAVAFPRFGIVEWVTLVPAGIFLLTCASDPAFRLRRLYGYGLFFFMCYYVVVYHWFVNLYPLEFIDGMTKGAALAVVLVAWFGLSLLQALGGGLVFVLAGVLFRTRLCRRYGLLKPFVAAALWAVFEWSQTLGWWGVPWGRLPIGQTWLPAGIQTASWFGSYFITFLLVAVNFLLARIVLDRKCLRTCAVLAAALLVFQYGAGTALWIWEGKREGKEVRVAAIQGNIASGEKWSSESTSRTLEVYRLYTEKAAQDGAEIVVWPETALPYTLIPENSMWNYVSSLAKTNNITILVGAFTPSDETGEYNSILCFLPDGSALDTVYSKRRLVPFGEFVPMRGLISTLIPPLAELVMVDDDVAQGEDGQVFVLPQGNLGSLICFDSIYEELTRESVLEGAELICLSTNDSWFTDSAALYMHNAQAQLRAVESGRYVVRAANTGVSTMISSRGEVLELLEPLVDGYLCTDVKIQSHMTLYDYIGNSFVWLCIGFAVLLMGHDIGVCLTERRRKGREKSET